MMNFGTQSQSSTAASIAARRQSSNRFNGKPEATGFLNFSLPTTEGGTASLGGLPLHEHLAAHGPLLNALMKGPEQAKRVIAEYLAKNLIIDFKPNVKREVSYAIPDMTEAQA